MMRKNGKLLFFLFLFCSLPILASLDPITYDSSYHAKYESPEGIQFLSYSETWNEQQLEDLYQELLKNKHGDEINLLQEIRVMGGESTSHPNITGIYQPLLNSITLYKGNQYTEASDYRDTLSHEYGHHFAYHYFPSHHFPFSKWAELRGLDDMPVRWNSFFNYSISDHKWHPQEIFAEDYVLLYGATNEVTPHDVTSNEAFYMRTQHENQELQNVLGNEKLHAFLEHETGVKIDEERKLHTPKLDRVTDEGLTFSISKKKDVAYRLNLSNYEDENMELFEITDDASGSITFLLDDVELSEISLISVDVVDLNTSIGYVTDEFRFKLEE
ncbi:hypothetical protein [Ferdinandcohnia sp. Marseille-Q9671]